MVDRLFCKGCECVYIYRNVCSVIIVVVGETFVRSSRDVYDDECGRVMVRMIARVKYRLRK